MSNLHEDAPNNDTEYYRNNKPWGLLTKKEQQNRLAKRGKHCGGCVKYD